MKLKRSFLSAVLGLTVLSGTVFAADIDSLANLLAEQGVITYGQARQLITESNEKERQELASGESRAVPVWVQNLSFNGDVRVRTQSDWNASKNTEVRERLRLRVGAATRPVDNVEIGFGFATGELKDDKDKGASSTNHTFNAMNKSPLFVDYAYIKYSPFDWISVNAGKVKNKTQVWNASDLIWDGDYNPDGFNLNISSDLSENFKFQANAGYYIFGTGQNTVSLPDAYIAQPIIEYKAGSSSLKIGLAYQQYNFADRSNSGVFASDGYDYRILNPTVEFGMKDVIASLGCKLFLDYASNSSDMPKYNGKDAKTGYLYGLELGHNKISKLGTWQVRAMYRYLEKYAIPEGLGDSDAYGGKTSSKGYEVSATLGLVKNLSLAADYYEMTDIDGNKPQSLFQMDFVYKF